MTYTESRRRESASRASTRGRSSLPLVLALFAIAVVGGLFATGVISLGTSGSDSDADLENDALLLEGEGTADDDDDQQGEGALASLYGEGDLGAVKLRLVWLSDKSPLADQAVQLIGRTGKVFSTTNSDADGLVRIGQLPPFAQYSIMITGDGFARVLIRGIEVARAETNDLGNIMLGTRVVLRGRVISHTGKPLPNTSVSVHELRRNMMQQGFLFALASEATNSPLPLEAVKSDGEGYFTFAMLQDGSYRLVARQGGYASKHESDVLVSDQAGERLIMIVLGPGATATGTVKTEDGKAVAGAQVVAYRFYAGRRQMMRMRLEREVTTTDEAGRYELDTLTIGASYAFGVIADGYPTIIDQRGTEIETNHQRDFVLPKGGTISGTVLAKATGKPIANAQVAVALGQMRRGSGEAKLVETDEAGRFEMTNLMPGPVMSLAVKAKGFITSSRSMWTGNGMPDLESEGEQDLTIEMEAGGKIEGEVRDSAGEPIIGATVSVYSQNFGAMFTGIPGATTGADGTYEILGLSKASYTVAAQAEGYANVAAEQAVEVPEGSSVRARTIELTEAGRAVGLVRTPEGEPLVGARVRAQGREPRPEGNSTGGRGRGRGGNWMRRIAQRMSSPVAVTDAEGRFTLKGLGPKMDWTLSVQHDEYVETDSKRFRVKAGEQHETEITMQIGATLSGIATDENGERAANVRIRIGTLDPEVARRPYVNSWEADRSLRPEVLVTDSEGKFKATNLEAGVLVLRAQKDGYIDFYRRNVRVKPGQQFADYRVRLSTGEKVTGTVFGADGEPLRRAWVSLDTRANPSFGGGGGDNLAAEGESGGETVAPRLGSRTDDQGRFTIEQVPPATYSALVWFAPGHKGYRDESDAAIQRNYQVPGGGDLVFRLEAGGPQMGGGR